MHDILIGVHFEKVELLELCVVWLEVVVEGYFEAVVLTALEIEFVEL